MKPDFAFYYPGQYWWDPDWIKNLILFFDGIAMVIPEYMNDYGSVEDYPIVSSLEDRGMFHVVRPEEAVGQRETEILAEALVDIITSGRLDYLTTGRGARDTSFGSLSMSRLGYYGDRKLAEFVVRELKARGLAGDSKDGVSIPIEKTVRSIILVLLAQILKFKGERMGLTLSPATDRPRLVDALNEVISDSDSATESVGDIVSFDMAMVGVDLSSVPMDEVLDFREQNYVQRRDYRLAVRSFARELSRMPEDERQDAFERRQDELDDAARAIKKASWEAWRKPASFSFGLAGAALTFLAGNPVGAAIAAAGSAIAGIPSARANEIGVYSYLFSARQSF